MATLEIPWEMKGYFVPKYGLKPRGGSLYIFSGKQVPAELQQFLVPDFSYGKWVEDEALIAKGGTPPNPKVSTTRFTPYPHQLEAAKAILSSYTKGWPGFLLADSTGLGKTLGTLVGVAGITKLSGYTKEKPARVLIVCPKGVIPVWRQTLRAYPTALIRSRFLIINYEQAQKLLSEPTQAKNAKRRRTKNRAKAKHGKNVYDWNVIVFDEGHKLKNYPSSTVSQVATSIARLEETYVKGKSPFVIYSTATPGSSPLNFSLMAPWLAQLLSTSYGKGVTPSKWAPFLAKLGFSVTEGKVGWNWITVPWYGKNDNTPEGKRKQQAAEKKVKDLQRKDAMRIGQALKKPGAPFIRRSPTDIAGWPEQQFIPLPLDLSPDDRKLYEELWSVFRSWLRLTPARRDPQGALVQTLRYRQKSSLLKVDSIIDQVCDFVDQGNQVFISLEFIETLDKYKELLEKKKIPVAEISGRTTNVRENERLSFQKGKAKVVLCTVVEGISLHQEETLPDGTKATSAPRITFLHDVRQNPLDALQAVGRAHRSKKSSLTYIPFIEGTVDERVVSSFINKEANIKAMTAQDNVNALEDIFRSAAGGS